MTPLFAVSYHLPVNVRTLILKCQTVAKANSPKLMIQNPGNMPTPAMMVEVFKTNVQDSKQAERIVRDLRKHYPNCQATFDLEDCDRILRVQSIGAALPVLGILRRVNAMGYHAVVLPDELPADADLLLNRVEAG